MAFIPRVGANFPNDYYKPEIWSALTLERWYAEGMIPKICNTDYEGEIKGAGQLVHIRWDPEATISPYVKDTPIQWQDVADEKTTFTIDYAYSAAHKIDKIDLKQMDIGVVSKLATAINKKFEEKENELLFNALPLMSFNPLNLVDKSGSTQSPLSSSADYIINGLTSLRTAFNRRRMPKAGRWVAVAPEVEDILLRSDIVRYDVMGKPNETIQSGEFGLRIAGFDILVSEFVPQSAANIFSCPAGIKKAVTFARQLVDVSVGIDLQDYHGKGMKALNVFGFTLLRPDALGLWKVKVA